MRKTKIVCTIGPATDDENVLRDIEKRHGRCEVQFLSFGP